MKIYDKRIFKATEKMKVVALVMILFVFGFWYIERRKINN